MQRNIEYFKKVDKPMKQIAEGKVVVKTPEELEEMQMSNIF